MAKNTLLQQLGGERTATKADVGLSDFHFLCLFFCRENIISLHLKKIYGISFISFPDKS